MAELKTKQTETDVEAFLNSVSNEQKRQDCFGPMEMMQQVTGLPPKMWGDSMVGFGSYHYKYASGHEGDSFLTGFSPRKQNLTVYIMSGFDRYGELLGKPGKHSTSKSCLYIKKLADVNLSILAELVKQSVKHMQKTNP